MLDNDLISRSALMQYIEDTHPYAGLPMAAHICTMELLTYAPTAEAKEVVYAEWLVPDRCYPDTCSNCKFEFIWDGDDDYLPKYCPECGAAMTGRRLLYI